jgi:hypothetical protein
MKQRTTGWILISIGSLILLHLIFWAIVSYTIPTGYLTRWMSDIALNFAILGIWRMTTSIILAIILLVLGILNIRR